MEDSIRFAPHLQFSMNFVELQCYRLKKDSDWPLIVIPRIVAIWHGTHFETPVIPAKAGIQSVNGTSPKLRRVDSRFRRNDCDFRRPGLADDTTTRRLMRLTEMLDERLFSAANICIVGNVNRDIKISPIPAGNYLFADGETTVTSVTETVGGGGANSALAAAALGARVAFLGRVGADGLGDRLERTLTSHGISAYLKKASGCPTGTSVNLTFTSGHRHFLSSLPNNASLAFEDLDLLALEGFDHLLRADIWFSDAMLYGGHERLFRQAREAGRRISMNLMAF